MAEEIKLTGYPSIDKPWLKYYREEAINSQLPECTIYEYLWECNKEHLEDIALVYFGKTITYKQLFKNIDKAANALVSIGVSEKDIISMCVTNTPEAVYCFYGANKIGAVCNMLDLRASAEELERFIYEVKSSYVITLDVIIDKISLAVNNNKQIKVVVLSPTTSLRFPMNLKPTRVLNHQNYITYKEFVQKGEKSTLQTSATGNSLAVIAHTGGTTGTPKSVMISNKSMVCIAFEYKMSGMPMNRGEYFLTIVPPFILNGLCTCLNLPLVCGVACILIPNFQQKDFPKYLKMKPEHIIAAPSWWERLRDDSQMRKMDLSFLVTAATGGDGISEKSEEMINEFLRAHGAKTILVCGYGMTETGSSVCTNTQEYHYTGSIGFPLCKSTFMVCDENNNELRYDEQGELCVAGPSIMDGYCGLSKSETSDVLKSHHNANWVHTGDLGHITRDGIIYVDGRIKRVIIREGGFKVYPKQIEEIIMSVKGVIKCAVVGSSCGSSYSGKAPIAFVNLEYYDSEIINRCIEICKQKLPEYCIPERFAVVNELPYTPIGKVDYRKLENMETSSMCQ